MSSQLGSSSNNNSSKTQWGARRDPLRSRTKASATATAKGAHGKPVAEVENPFKVDLIMQGNSTRCSARRSKKNDQNSRMGGQVANWIPNRVNRHRFRARNANSKKFSEESRDTIRELGNMEVHALGEISETVQCQACLKNALERVNLLRMLRMPHALAGREKTGSKLNVK